MSILFYVDAQDSNPSPTFVWIFDVILLMKLPPLHVYIKESLKELTPPPSCVDGRSLWIIPQHLEKLWSCYYANNMFNPLKTFLKQKIISRFSFIKNFKYIKTISHSYFRLIDFYKLCDYLPQILYAVELCTIFKHHLADFDKPL